MHLKITQIVQILRGLYHTALLANYATVKRGLALHQKKRKYLSTYITVIPDFQVQQVIFFWILSVVFPFFHSFPLPS